MIKDTELFRDIFDNYKDPLLEYERRIKSKGKDRILVPKTIRGLVNRHKRDLKNQKKSGYVYSKEIVAIVLYLNKGLRNNLNINDELELALFQRVVLALSFGWRKLSEQDGMTYNGYRKGQYTLLELLKCPAKHRTIVLTMSRKQGKTWLANNIMLTKNTLETQVTISRNNYIIAGAQKQSNDCLGQLQTMLMGLAYANPSDILLNKYVVNKKESTVLLHPNINGAYIWQCEAKAPVLDKLDGYLGVTVLIDEYSQFKSGLLLNRLSTGQVQLADSLMIISSTSNVSTDCHMYKTLLPMYKSMLKGDIKDDPSVLPIIYEQDTEDEADKPWTWVKSNPLLELCTPYLNGLDPDTKYTTKGVYPTNLFSNLLRDRESSKLNGTEELFKIKNLNYWLDVPDFALWDKPSTYNNVVLNSKDFDDAIGQLRGKEYTLGLDLSSRRDTTGIGVVVEDYENRKVYMTADSIIPYSGYSNIQDRAIKEKIPYDEYVMQGKAHVAQGDEGTIDHKQVVSLILDKINKYNSQGLIFKGLYIDPYNSDSVVADLERRGIKIMETRQSMLEISPVLKYYMWLVTTKVAVVDDNPLLTRANLINKLVVDAHDNMMISKRSQLDKIDSLASVLNALQYFAVERPLDLDTGNVYNTRFYGGY